jgi:hypothetical protein
MINQLRKCRTKPAAIQLKKLSIQKSTHKLLRETVLTTSQYQLKMQQIMTFMLINLRQCILICPSVNDVKMIMVDAYANRKNEESCYESKQEKTSSLTKSDKKKMP